jgi:hypothetical protein
MMLSRQLGRDVMSLSSHAGNDAVKDLAVALPMTMLTRHMVKSAYKY